MTTRASRVLAAAFLAAGAVSIVPAATATAATSTPCAIDNPQLIKSPDADELIDRTGFSRTQQLATGKDVVVAVIDSGVDVRNDHLREAVLPGKSFAGGKDGRVDTEGHGTAVAGIIAAREVPDSSLVGGAPGSMILPVRVYDTASEQGKARPSAKRTADGIRWATSQRVDVINVSLSAPAGVKNESLLRDAVAGAVAQDIVVVASGGNQPEPDKPLTADRFPAGLAGVIGVAAANDSGVVGAWSVHGPQVDVAAYGSSVLTAYLGAGDCVLDADTNAPQTSWSTAYVAALAAQLRERFPQETAAQIVYRIEATADRPVAGTRDTEQGWGFIEPYSALTMTYDNDRPGPPVPGQVGPTEQTSKVRLTPVVATPDPRGPGRNTLLWWAIGALGLTGSALVLRPWVGQMVDVRNEPYPGRRRRGDRSG